MEEPSYISKSIGCRPHRIRLLGLHFLTGRSSIAYLAFLLAIRYHMVYINIAKSKMTRKSKWKGNGRI